MQKCVMLVVVSGQLGVLSETGLAICSPVLKVFPFRARFIASDCSPTNIQYERREDASFCCAYHVYVTRVQYSVGYRSVLQQ